MKKNNLKYFFLGLLLFVSFSVTLNIFSLTDSTEEPLKADLLEIQPLEKIELNLNISAPSAIVAEVDKRGNEIIHFEKSKDRKLPIASISKLMTALVVFEKPSIFQDYLLISLSEEAVSQTDASRYKILEKGKTFTLKTLLNMLLVESNNAASYSLAEVMGEPAFIQVMNLKARELNMENTFFATSSGLDNKEKYNYSSVSDLVKLAKYVKEHHPEILKISKKETYHVFDSENEFYYFIPENTNRLLFEFSEIIGGKTGWTPRAGQCLLVVFSHPERDSYFVVVVLNSQDRFGDVKQIIELINGY